MSSSALLRIVLTAALVLGASLDAGCSQPLTHYLVETRNHQGDLALSQKNFPNAAVAYRLALQIAPDDEHARAGMAAVQLELAAEAYTHSKIDEALAALAIAAKYDPESVRLAELRGEVEQARVKREIVVSNFPTYSETGLALRKAYAQLHLHSNAIVTTLQHFDYSYDPNELLAAIKQSNVLGSEVGHLTARLVSYRQLVESGAPVKAGQSALAPASSLLPLP